MSTEKARSGKHSRFPAINREGRSAPPKAQSPVEVEAVAEAPTEDQIDLSSMSADDVLVWAGGDAERQSVALAFEQSRDRPRKTVLRELDPNFEG